MSVLIVEVLGGVESMPKGGLFQRIGIQYPGKRYPVEDRLFLRDGQGGGVADEPLKPGKYQVDIYGLVYPDPKSYNRMRLQRLKVSDLKPVPVRAAG